MTRRIQNLAGVFTGEGFARKQGRKPDCRDCGFRRGPLDIAWGADGRIVSVARSGKRAHPRKEALDGTGLFATAGFVDSHTHALFAGSRSAEFFQRWQGASYQEIARAGGGIQATVRATNQANDEALRGALRAVLGRMLRGGCTTVEVKSGYADSAAGELRLLRLIADVARAGGGPRVSPTFLGLHAVPPGGTSRAYCDEMIKALPAVCAMPLAPQVDSFPEESFFSLADCLRFSAAAQAGGLAVKAHADELTPLRASEAFVRLGARSIDHLEHISSRAVNLLAESSTVATLIPSTSFYLGIEHADARRLLDRGARVALASDYNPGTSPTPGLQLTLLLAANALRMTAAEILCAATYNAAAAVGRDRELGTLAPQRRADILLWNIGATSQDAQGSGIIEEIITRCLEPVAVVVDGRLRLHQFAE